MTTKKHLWCLEECIIHQSPDGVCCMKSTGFFHRANRRFCDLVGYSQEELQSLRIYDLATDVSERRWRKLWKKFRTQRVMCYDGNFSTRTEEVVRVEIRADLVRFAGQELMCSVVRAVDERR